jgi:anthranilate phosphoribosyltransferase
MLTKAQIGRLIRGELPEDKIRQALSHLCPDALNKDLICDFIDCIRQTCAFEPGFEIDCLDCSGTGGSGLPHFNTSTAAAFVLAAGGVKVAKFGNRASSGAGGSFDLLSDSGLQPYLDFNAALDMLDRVGLVFLFAPQYYPGLAQLAPIRKSLKTPTIFNAIGPLLHPYKPIKRVMGTADARVQELVAQYLAETIAAQASSLLRSVSKAPGAAIVVRSRAGLDEFDPADQSDYIRIMNGLILRGSIPPSAELGTSVQPTSAGENFACFQQLLEGKASPYITQLVCLNAGAGFAVWNPDRHSIESGAEYAAELIECGAVREKFEDCRRAYAGIPG